MSALDHPALLEQLIISGELLMQMRSTRSPATVDSLLMALSAEYAKPVDGVRVIDRGVMIFASAVEGAAASLWSNDRKAAEKYVRVIGVLMPEIREAFSMAIEIRKRPSA